MSKVKLNVALNRYICAELELIRTMIKTHDYSALEAAVERIQEHGERMEAGLWAKRSKIVQLKRKVRDLKAKQKGKAK